MKTKLAVLLAFFMGAATAGCGPVTPQVVVVTATAPPATQTPFVLVVTATPLVY